MSFTVRIGADVVPVEPGATVPVSFEIANRSDEADRFEIAVEGLDPEWVAIPVPSFPVEGRDIHQEKIFLKPPRLSESRAGDYPFVVTVRSLENGESRTVQAVLSVQPFHYLSMEITPKKGSVSAWRKHNTFTVTLINLGNTEHSVQLRGADPEDELTYAFAEELIELSPGQTRAIEVTPNTLRSRPFSSARLHGFQVTARSTTVPSIACSATAQLEERPVISPGMLLLGFFALVVFVGWWMLLPKPPILDSLTLDNENPNQGDTVHVRWKATNATGVQITVNGQPLVQGAELEGEKSFVAQVSGEVRAYAYRDTRQSESQTRVFTVHVPEEAPTPTITSFDISPREVKLGGKILVRYKIEGPVTSLTLAPAGVTLDPALSQLSVVADIKGDINYELVAENHGKTDRRTIRVRVIEASKAAIVVFKSDVKELPVEGGPVRLTWQVSNAERVELTENGGAAQTLGVEGERDFLITQDTEFVLTAYDDQGMTVQQTVKVSVKKPESVPPPSTTGG